MPPKIKKVCATEVTHTEKCVTLDCYHTTFSDNTTKYAKIESAFLPKDKNTHFVRCQILKCYVVWLYYSTVANKQQQKIKA